MGIGLLPRLARGRSVLLASVVVGAIWAVWHLLTAFFLPVSIARFPLYALAVTSSGVIIGWLWARTGGSVVIAMLYHGAMNLPLVDKDYAHGALPWALAASATALVTVVLPWGKRPSGT